ncbi:MAG: hypothetical protein K0Q73_6134 [Paenibacillus sp.]|jgi:hypothetical protein|nr:hypothetical protein [Paenibacillus sp.]
MGKVKIQLLPRRIFVSACKEQRLKSARTAAAEIGFHVVNALQSVSGSNSIIFCEKGNCNVNPK